MASLKWGGWEGSKGLGGGGGGAVQWLGWPWQVVSELEVETQQEQGHGRKEGETKHLTEMPDCGKEHREGKSALLKLSHPAIVGPISASVITRTLFSPMFPPTTLYQGCCAKVSHGLKESMGYHSVMLQGLLRLRHQSWGRGATWAPGFQPA